MIIHSLSSNSNFYTEILNSPIPVLVIFSASWCGPCQTLKETLNEALGNFTEKSPPGKFKIVIIDIDKYPEITKEYNIRALPTYIIFSNKERKRFSSSNVDIFNILNEIKAYTN